MREEKSKESARNKKENLCLFLLLSRLLLGRPRIRVTVGLHLFGVIVTWSLMMVFYLEIKWKQCPFLTE